MKKGNESKKAGFSLIELIVVISIMAVLGTVLAPQLLRHVNNNRITACKTDREAILAVYERCIYAQTKELSTDALNAVLTGMDAATKDEVQQYDACPSSGSFTGEVDGDVAIIHCSHTGHEDVVVDFIGWNGTELAEGIDDPLDPPPVSTEPETEEPTSEEETTTVEPGGSSYWPYADDPRWEGKKYPGAGVEISVPSGLFTTREGNTYVIVDKNGTGKFTVNWEWNLGPENIDTLTWWQCVSWSGVTIEDYTSVLHPNGKQLTGIHNGDILIYNDKRYIYVFPGGEQVYIDFPDKSNSNFYLVDP